MAVFDAKPSQRYCKRTVQLTCAVCSSAFKSECCARLRSTCSLSCSRRLTRLSQAASSSEIPCQSCDNKFQPKVTGATHCRQMIEAKCIGCESLFQRLCKASPQSYCTTSCRNKTMRATKYRLTERKCRLCDSIYTPQSARQKVCDRAHSVECEYCHESFVPTTQQRFTDRLGLFCSNSCSTLVQTESSLRLDRLPDYRDPRDWVDRFQEKNGRQPAQRDFKLDTGASPAAKWRGLFKKGSESVLEAHVIEHLKTILPHSLSVKRNQRIIRNPDSGGLLELDIVIAGLRLAFEVQDNWTHSQTEGGMFVYGLKKGPEYHERKRQLAFKQLGIRVVDIWEDEIESGVFRSTVLNAMQEAAVCNGKMNERPQE